MPEFVAQNLRQPRDFLLRIWTDRFHRDDGAAGKMTRSQM